MEYIYCFRYIADGEDHNGYAKGEMGTDLDALTAEEGPLIAAAHKNHPGMDVSDIMVEFFSMLTPPTPVGSPQ